MIDPTQLLSIPHHNYTNSSMGVSFSQMPGGATTQNSTSANTPGRRRQSALGKSPKGSLNRHNSVMSTGSGSGAGSISQHSQSQSHGTYGFPTGAQVPAAFYREIEEQLADALFKRTQAKLMADPDQANVESALADGLKVYSLLRAIFCSAALTDYYLRFVQFLHRR